MVHGHSSSKQRDKFWEGLIRISRRVEGTRLVLGKFNKVQNKEERVGVHARVSL